MYSMLVFGNKHCFSFLSLHAPADVANIISVRFVSCLYARVTNLERLRSLCMPDDINSKNKKKNGEKDSFLEQFSSDVHGVCSIIMHVPAHVDFLGIGY